MRGSHRHGIRAVGIFLVLAVFVVIGIGTLGRLRPNHYVALVFAPTVLIIAVLWTFAILKERASDSKRRRR